MKICIYALYGGVGKSSLAAELALTLNLQVITNDVYTPLSIVFDKNDLLRLQPTQNMPKLDNDMDIIFDLGGYPDARAIVALQQSDCVLVPTIADTNRLKGALNTINEILKYNKNILVIANRADSKGEDLKTISSVINTKFPKIPVFEIKESRAIPNIISDKMSVHQQIENGSGIIKFHFQTVCNQLDQIIKYIKKF